MSRHWPYVGCLLAGQYLGISRPAQLVIFFPSQPSHYPFLIIASDMFEQHRLSMSTPYHRCLFPWYLFDQPAADSRDRVQRVYGAVDGRGFVSPTLGLA